MEGNFQPFCLLFWLRKKKRQILASQEEAFRFIFCSLGGARPKERHQNRPLFR